MLTSNKDLILRTIVIFGLSLLLAEIVFYYYNFDFLLKDRVFLFTRPEYSNSWLGAYIIFAILTRILGLFRLFYKNKQGYREYAFGQLMLLALLCKEFFRYSFYVYSQHIINSGNWNTLSSFLTLFLLESGLLIFFFFSSAKMATK